MRISVSKSMFFKIWFEARFDSSQYSSPNLGRVFLIMLSIFEYAFSYSCWMCLIE